MFTTDYIIGASVFVLVLGGCNIMWDKTAARVADDFRMEELTASAMRASGALVRSPGVPEDWERNATHAKAVGFAGSGGALSGQKLSAAEAMGDDELRWRLGVGAHRLRIRVSDSSGSTLMSAGAPPSDGYAANVRRVAVLDNRTVMVDVTVWDSSGSAMSPAAGS